MNISPNKYHRVQLSLLVLGVPKPKCVLNFHVRWRDFFVLSLHVMLAFCMGSLEWREGVDDVLVQAWSPHLILLAWSAASQTVLQWHLPAVHSKKEEPLQLHRGTWRDSPTSHPSLSKSCLDTLLELGFLAMQLCYQKEIGIEIHNGAVYILFKKYYNFWFKSKHVST